MNAFLLKMHVLQNWTVRKH